MALDPELKGEFARNARGVQVENVDVRNPDWQTNPHSSTGYLATEAVRTVVRDVAGSAFTQVISRAVIVRDLVRDLENGHAEQRFPTLIQIDIPEGDTDDGSIDDRRRRLRERIEQLAKQREAPPDLVRLQVMRRFVSADLTREDVETLRNEFKQLQIQRIWKNLSKRALIAQSSGTVQARPPLLVLLLALMGALLVSSSRGKRLAYDEGDNLGYGYRLLSSGLSAPANGQRMLVLAFNALSCPAQGCRIRLLQDDERGRLLVRAPTMVSTLLLGLLVWRWCFELAGPGAAWLALVLYVTNPSFLAHGRQVTSDVVTALFATIAAWAWWRLVRARGHPATRVVLAGVGCAGAIVSKYTGLLIFPAFLVLAVLEACRPLRDPRIWDRALLARRLGQLAATAALVLILARIILLSG